MNKTGKNIEENTTMSDYDETIVTLAKVGAQAALAPFKLIAILAKKGLGGD